MGDLELQELLKKSVCWGIVVSSCSNGRGRLGVQIEVGAEYDIKFRWYRCIQTRTTRSVRSIITRYLQ